MMVVVLVERKKRLDKRKKNAKNGHQDFPWKKFLYKEK